MHGYAGDIRHPDVPKATTQGPNSYGWPCSRLLRRRRGRFIHHRPSVPGRLLTQPIALTAIAVDGVCISNPPAPRRRLLKGKMSLSLDMMVLDDDAHVVADGWIFAGGGQNWLQPLQVQGGRPEAARTQLVPHVPLLGLRADEGEVFTSPAAVTGAWTGGAIHVDSVLRTTDTPSPAFSSFSPEWLASVVPLPPESKGRISTTGTEDEAALRKEDVLLSKATFSYQDGNQRVLMTVTDREKAEELLRPYYGDCLYIVQSSWDRHILDSVIDELSAHAEEWCLLGGGQGLGTEGDIRCTGRVRQIIPDIARWHRSLPEGLLEIQPWIRPLTTTWPN